MRTVLTLLVTLSLIACGNDDSEPSTPSSPPSTVSDNAATGNSTTGASSAKNPWVGTWALGGTQSTTCGGASGSTQLNGITIITPSEDAPASIETKYSSTCTLVWNVKDGSGTATVAKDQVCTVAVNDFNVTVSLTSGTMTLNGKTMTALLSGTTNNGCSFTQQETLTLM